MKDSDSCECSDTFLYKGDSEGIVLRRTSLSDLNLPNVLSIVPTLNHALIRGNSPVKSVKMIFCDRNGGFHFNNSYHFNARVLVKIKVTDLRAAPTREIRSDSNCHSLVVSSPASGFILAIKT